MRPPLPLDPAFVARAEQKLGARLPPAYVEKMVQANGGTVELDGEGWELHPMLAPIIVRGRPTAVAGIVHPQLA